MIRVDFGLAVFALALALAGGAADVRGAESSEVPMDAFDLPPSVDQRSDGVPVYHKEIVSKVFTIDRIYKSMQGPQGMHEFDFGIEGPPELLWLVGYEARMMGPDASEELSREYMCHNHLLINEKKYHDRFPSRIRTAGDRLFDLAQGQLGLKLPEGYGVPWMSDEKLVINAQVLNHNFVGDSFDVRVRIKVDYLRDKDLPKPLKPLVQRGVFGMKLLEGRDGHFGVGETEEVSMEDHGPGCAVGEDAGSPKTIRDGEGRAFTGFWVVPPGRETNHTRVTPQLGLPYDTTIHYISVHLHPFGESLALRDLTTGETLYESKTRQVDQGLGLASVEHFSSEEGIPVYKDHEYELVSVYNNTTDIDQDAMTTMFIYLHAKDIYDFDLRPRSK